MDKNKLLADVYKYYSIGTVKNESKENLRQEKTKNRHQEFFKALTEFSENYTVIDWTNEESCCYEYKILMHKNQDLLDDDIVLLKALGGVRNDLYIFISALEPYYHIFAEETNYITQEELSFKKIEINDPEIKILANKIDDYFSQIGYVKLSEEDVITPVPNVETELRELNKAIVFDCLFTDLDGY